MPKRKRKFRDEVDSPVDEAVAGEERAKTAFDVLMGADASASAVLDGASGEGGAVAEEAGVKAFTAHDFASLAENEYMRYAPNAKKIGHAVITMNDGKATARQYALPAAKDDDAPAVRPLLKIEAIEPFRGMERFRAETPGGTAMYARRFINGRLVDDGDEEAFQIACFSPSFRTGKPPFWGSIRPTPVFRADLTADEKADLAAELKEMKQVVKGGDELEVEPDSVRKRDLIKRRNPSQNAVMGESARDAYEGFFDAMADELHPEMRARLKRAFTADIRNFKENGYRPEWLHAKGWSLVPMSQDPQKKDNLGAAPKWTNTQMMILERIVKWFALNAPECMTSIQPRFEMLLDSELIHHIDFKAKVRLKQRFIEYAQSIDPFLKWPMFSKASDLAQGAGITHSILSGVDPVSVQVVGEDAAAASAASAVTHAVSASHGDKLADASGTSAHADAAVSAAAGGGVSAVTKAELSGSAVMRAATSVAAGGVVGADGKAVDDMAMTSAVEDGKRRRLESGDAEVGKAAPKPKSASGSKKFPTASQYDRSVVQVYADSFIPDYDHPWRDPEPMSSTGSGFVVQHEGKNYIVTNAHVAENLVFQRVRLANNRHKKYEARVVQVSYQCDLALLAVDDPEFNEQAVPVELGDMVSLRDKIMVVGFPMGGDEMSLSRGIVSRIQVDTYSMSMQELLQVQVDAAVNPGNSGGPTFAGNKVVGVAFQGYNGHQGLNYIIPIPILQHFLQEALSGKKYRGFPTIPAHLEELENPYERAYHQLGDKTGIRVQKIDNLSDAYTKLKEDDILFSIDGLAISNEGTVDIPGVGNCISMSHVTQTKYIGDSVTLGVLRKDPKTGVAQELEVEVLLDTILGDTEKVSVSEHDKMPTFYINSGLSFAPLTRNYMDGEGTVFDEMIIAELGCSLPDAPKKSPDEQIVVINDIIKCRETEGYDKHIRGIVRDINGRHIKNIRDVVRAMEAHEGENHVITLVSKAKVIVPRMTSDQLAKVLKRNHISHDRSEDLRADAKATLVEDGKDRLLVESLELTQLGMQAIFERMGYPGVLSGSIYNDVPDINVEALNARGFMPVLTDVGVGQVSGHWIMLIKGEGSQYFIFDPLGQASARGYRDMLLDRLPEGATLTAIPNAAGLNRGLCGYWVASAGLRAHAALTQDAPIPLDAVGENATEEMRAELSGHGFMQIINWLHSVAEAFPGDASDHPIDATALRRETQAPLLGATRLVSAATTPATASATASASASATPASVSLFGRAPKVSAASKKPAAVDGRPKRRRVIDDSDSSGDEDAESVDSVEAAKAGALLAGGTLPGMMRYQGVLAALEARYKDMPTDGLDDDDDDYEVALSSGSSQSSADSESDGDDEDDVAEREVSPVMSASPMKLRGGRVISRHRFIGGQSVARDDAGASAAVSASTATGFRRLR